MESTFLNDIEKAPFLFLNDHPWDYFSPISNVIDKGGKKTICDDETFRRTFLSELNIEYINLAIKKTIYNNTCDRYIVTDQKREHLIQIMEGIYHDYAQHLPFNQKEQFNTLNKLVIDYCVKTIIVELDTRYKYMRDKFSPLELLPSPINTSKSGSKSFIPLITSNYNLNNYIDTPIKSQQKPDIFNKKVITPQLNYKTYNFTNDNSNMFSKIKKII